MHMPSLTQGKISSANNNLCGNLKTLLKMYLEVYKKI
jgi:hypothetical protein